MQDQYDFTLVGKFNDFLSKDIWPKRRIDLKLVLSGIGSCVLSQTLHENATEYSLDTVSINQTLYVTFFELGLCSILTSNSIILVAFTLFYYFKCKIGKIVYYSQFGRQYSGWKRIILAIKGSGFIFTLMMLIQLKRAIASLLERTI